eukprot:3828843-Ditylum_brightwellii.AAC.1
MYLLKVPQFDLSYEGTKDKVAITYSHVVAKDVDPEKLDAFSNQTVEKIRLGNFTPVHLLLALGGCAGNRSSVVIRITEGTADTIQHAKDK